MNRVRLIAAALALTISSAAMAAGSIVMHRDPGCPCCMKWAQQVKAAFGREVRVIDDSRRTALLTKEGVPARLRSCHTAIVDGMLFEGHVPIADMKRVLAERPKGVRGLAVAGMPLGSPGMEVPGRPAQSYEVIAFGPGGQRLYARR